MSTINDTCSYHGQDNCHIYRYIYISFQCVVKFALKFNGIEFDCVKGYIFMIQLPFGACAT